MSQDAPRWIDTGDLNWSPEDDLRFAGPASEPKWRKRFVGPGIEEPIFTTAPANTDAPAARHTGARLAIGLAQGLALFALLRARDLGLLPDPYLFATLSLPLLLAPLLVLEGLDSIAPRALIPWTAIAALILAGLGFYQRWRIDVPLPAHAGYALIVLSALFLFIGQALVHGGARAGKGFAPYPEYFRASWTLAARLLVWAPFTALAWALTGGVGGLLAAAHLSIAPAMLGMPLTAMAGAYAFSLLWPTKLKNPLVTALTFALPLLAAASIALAISTLGPWHAPLWLLVLDAAALIAGINASHRGGPDHTPHPLWRKAAEFIATGLVPVLAGLAAAALAARVGEHGWTANRIFTGAAIFAIISYGIPYLAAAFIALGGGGWMQRIEEPNIALAFALAVAALALASPLADPMRLAAASQVARLQAGLVREDGFDFAALARDDARFGYETLQALAHDASPAIARDATLTLAAPPREMMAPTQVGANITVRTSGARLPAALLSRDWSALPAADVPPCLTSPRMTCEAWFMDLDGDGRDEILLVYGSDSRWWATALKEKDGVWNPAGTLASPNCWGSLAALRDGHFTITAPLPGWRDLLVGGSRLSFSALSGKPCAR